MSGWKRSVFGAVLLLIIFFTLAYAALYFFVQSARFQEWLKLEVVKKTGYAVDVGDFRLSPPFSLTAEALTVSKFSRMLFQSERIILTLSPLDLFSKSIHRLQLRKPTVYLDVHELFDATSKTPMDIAIRHLNIAEGTVVLVTGDGNHVDFRDVTMDAENLNLGRTAGLKLGAELPWLQARAEIEIRGQAEEKEAEIRIQQTTAPGLPGFLTPKSRKPEALTAHIKTRKKESQALEVLVSGKLNGLRVGNEKVNGQFDFHAAIDPGFKDANFAGKITADLSLNRFLPLSSKKPVIATVEGNYSIPEKLLALKTLHLDSEFGTVDGRGSARFGPRPVFANTHLNLRRVDVERLKPLLPETLRGWTYGGSAEADLEIQGAWPAIAIKGVVRSEEAQLKNEIFSLARLSLRAPFEWVNGSVRANGIQISGKTFAISQKDRPQISAEEVRIDCGFEKKPNQPLNATGRVQIRRGRFATPDSQKIGENLSLSVRFDAIAAHDKGVTANGQLNIEQGEILWGKFFSDLKTQRPALDFDGDYVASEDALRLRRFNLSLANIGQVELTGSVGNISKSAALQVEAKSLDIQPAGFFEFFIRETLKRSYPILDQLIVSGRVGFSVRAQGSLDDLTANGDVQLRAGEVREKSDKWQIGPMDLALPFRVHWPAADLNAVAPNIRTGTLIIGSARLGAESIPTLKTTVSLWNNMLRFEQPIRIPIYGGTVEISSLTWKDVIGNFLELSLSIDAKNVQLQKMTEALNWYRFGGSLSGSIPQVEWTGNSLRSQGQIQMQIFGGRLQISRMEIENPFSSLPSTKLDSRFQDIDLERASETFEFGRISGILEGSVNGLVITNGQPAQFVADIHSVDKSGSSQWISVEALNKITVLSSGNDAGVLYGGLAGFFENFRYRKLGFRATLKNDKLTLRGIESRDGKEFLVVGSLLPPTVNIISHIQEISFGELLRRLEQIRKSDKPQIK
jgi:hypothetical protein